MQTVLVLAVFVALAAASPVPDAPLRVVPLISRTERTEPSGAFVLDYKTGDGITLSEKGTLVPTLDRKDTVLVKEGVISYTAPDGTPIVLSYIADANGFRPAGTHLPVPVVAIPARF